MVQGIELGSACCLCYRAFSYAAGLRNHTIRGNRLTHRRGQCRAMETSRLSPTIVVGEAISGSDGRFTIEVGPPTDNSYHNCLNLSLVVSAPGYVGYGPPSLPIRSAESPDCKAGVVEVAPIRLSPIVSGLPRASRPSPLHTHGLTILEHRPWQCEFPEKA